MKLSHLSAGAISIIAIASLCGCSNRTSPGQPKQSGAAVQPAPPKDSAAPAPRKWVEAAAAKPSAPLEGEGWKKLLDGYSLDGWRVIDYAGAGEVETEAGVLILNMGDPFTGIVFTNTFATKDYEISLDAMRVMGTDFFCGLTIPVGTNHCSLILGGWGGSLVGISSLNGMDASENETTKFVNFEKERWYRVRVRVADNKLQAWVDEDRLVDVELEGKAVGVRPGEIERSRPLGITCWQTTAAVRNVKWRGL